MFYIYLEYPQITYVSLYILPFTQPTVKCSNVPYPQHPQQSRRGACDAVVASSKPSPSGTMLLKPVLTYVYHSISASLARILPRMCSQILPMDNTGEATHLFDITDGKAIKSQVCT